MIDPRPDPEKILKRVQEEERKERRGKLKIYLGAAPGVGKTYEMMHDAVTERNKGLDVVIGVVESHGRQEISEMMKNFERLPKQRINYHGRLMEEFDIDLALKRNPGLILIDEMAHTNLSGLRHVKRWQDIKELLDRGINVYTTLNVQHIESLNDDVRQIIQAPVKETVPDFMIDAADSIKLVDLPPEELLKRLREGKIYIAEQAALAVEHYFRLGNLIALRAIALGVTAERVGAEVLTYRKDRNIQHIWPTKEKILVCVGPDPESIPLIRAARRIASNLPTEWVAVYVETPHLKSFEATHNSAIENLRFAQQLGAETRVLSGTNIVDEIIHFAREQNVTQIMIRKGIRSRLRELFRRNLADEIVRHSEEIDVYLMTSGHEKKPQPKTASSKSPANWSGYLLAISSTVLATVLNTLLDPYMTPINQFMIYLLSVIPVALTSSRLATAFATVLAILLYGFFFIPPYYRFSVDDIQPLLSFLVLFIVTQIITHLTLIRRRQADSARFSEQQISAMYKLSQQLASRRGEDKLLEASVQFIEQQFNSSAMIFLAEKGHLRLKHKQKNVPPLSEKEFSIAQWVCDLGQPAGLGTETLPFAEALYLPLMTSKGAIGVLRIKPAQPKNLFSPEQMHLLEGYTNQIALAIDVDRAQEQSSKQAATGDKNFISNVVLQSIVHDLRMPLASIMVSASEQIALAKSLTPMEIRTLGENIYFESEQLTRLINNFQLITALESKTLSLNKQTQSFMGVLEKVINLSNIKLGKRSLLVQADSDLPNLSFDAELIKTVLINLIDNAIKLSKPVSQLTLVVKIETDHLLVSMEDEGPGIKPDEINKLFEKFYRGRMLTTVRGLGLGLAICNRIIKAHHGKIWAENREQGGAAFRFTLPLNLT